jgi:hypothetical protein
MRVGKAKRAHQNASFDAMVGTALTRLCPLYAFTSLIRPALAIEIAELGVAERPQAGAVEIHEAQPPPT